MLAVAISAGFGAVSAMQMPTGTVADWRPTITPLTAPSGANSAQPQMTVSPRGILLSWIERTGTRATLKFAERTPPAGRRADRRRRRRLVRQLGRRAVGAAPRQRHAGGALAAEERTARPTRTTSGWRTPRTTGGRGRRRSRRITTARSASTASPRSSRCRAPGLGLIWLDGRAMGSAEGHDAHGASGGAMSVRFGTFDTRVEADRARCRSTCGCASAARQRRR